MPNNYRIVFKNRLNIILAEEYSIDSKNLKNSRIKKSTAVIFDQTSQFPYSFLTRNKTYKRIIEIPLWEEYARPLKSTVSDLNNLGTREAQSTIAGKFLEHFTDYNWIHFDSAGVSFQFEKEGYLPAGGTGYGTRLLYNFLKKFN